MPFDESFFLAGIVGLFVVFSLGLAWVSWQDSRHRRKKR